VRIFYGFNRCRFKFCTHSSSIQTPERINTMRARTCKHARLSMAHRLLSACADACFAPWGNMRGRAHSEASASLGDKRSVDKAPDRNFRILRLVASEYSLHVCSLPLYIGVRKHGRLVTLPHTRAMLAHHRACRRHLHQQSVRKTLAADDRALPSEQATLMTCLCIYKVKGRRLHIFCDKLCTRRHSAQHYTVSTKPSSPRFSLLPTVVHRSETPPGSPLLMGLSCTCPLRIYTCMASSVQIW